MSPSKRAVGAVGNVTVSSREPKRTHWRTPRRKDHRCISDLHGNVATDVLRYIQDLKEVRLSDGDGTAPGVAPNRV